MIGKGTGQPGLGAESHGRESPATTGRKQEGRELQGQQENGVKSQGTSSTRQGRGHGLGKGAPLLLPPLRRGPARPRGRCRSRSTRRLRLLPAAGERPSWVPAGPQEALPKPRSHGRRVGTRRSQAAGTGTAFPRSPARLRLCPPSLAVRQHPGTEGTGIAALRSPPGPRGRVLLRPRSPHPAQLLVPCQPLQQTLVQEPRVVFPPPSSSTLIYFPHYVKRIQMKPFLKRLPRSPKARVGRAASSRPARCCQTPWHRRDRNGGDFFLLFSTRFAGCPQHISPSGCCHPVTCPHQ